MFEHTHSLDAWLVVKFSNNRKSVKSDNPSSMMSFSLLQRLIPSEKKAALKIQIRF